jgi:hypothetical protein
MDIGKIRTLGKLFMKIETRSRDGSRRKMALLVFSFLLPGIFLPLLLFKQSTDPSGFEFTFLTYLFYSLIIAFTVINEFDNLIISSTEAEVITALPLDDELLVNAKLFVILRYVFFISLPLLIPGSIYYYLVLKSGVRSVLYFVSGFMLFLFLINILLLLYSIALRNFKPQKLGTYTLILQVFLIFFLIIGYQFVSYSFTNRTSIGITSYFEVMQKNNFLLFFPQSWFGFIPVKKDAALDYHLILKALLPVLVCYLSYLSLKYYLEVNYKYIREKYLYSRMLFAEQNVSSRAASAYDRIRDVLLSVYLRNHTEEASFSLMRSSFKNDKTVRLNILPMIAIPVGLAVFALITDQLRSPFIQNYIGARPVFHITIFITVLVVLNTAALGIRVTNYPGASWVYEAYPIASKKFFINGIRKFFVLYLLIPVCSILFIFFIFKMPLVHSVLHTLYILASALLFNSIFHVFTKTLPFTKENTIYNSIQRITTMIFPFIFGVLMIALQYYIYSDILNTSLAILALYIINYLVVLFGLKV